MVKALEVNDTAAQNGKRRPDRPAGERLEGKSFQVNENSVEEGEPVHSSAPRSQASEAKANEQKIEGKALQVNENSVEDEEPAASPVPPR